MEETSVDVSGRLSPASSGLLRSKLSMPSAYDLAEAVFLGMPKAHQEKYAEKHDEVETDLVALKNAFSQYLSLIHI